MVEERHDVICRLAVAEAGRPGMAAERLTLTEQTPVRVIGRLERKLLAPALAGGITPSPETGFDAVSPAPGVSVPDGEGGVTDSGSQWPGGRPLPCWRHRKVCTQNYGKEASSLGSTLWGVAARASRHLADRP